MLPLGQGVVVMVGVGVGLGVAVLVGAGVTVSVGGIRTVGGAEVGTALQLEETISSTSARSTDPADFFMTFFL
jgi:hypothetical protein